MWILQHLKMPSLRQEPTQLPALPHIMLLKHTEMLCPATLLASKLKLELSKRFKKVGISNPNMSEIISITDAEGNEYYEVDYLSQDMIFREVPNMNFKNDNVPSILKPYLVSRKFVVERGRTNTVIQFGSGKAAGTNVIADPGAVAMDIYGKDYITDTTFDPTRPKRK